MVVVVGHHCGAGELQCVVIIIVRDLLGSLFATNGKSNTYEYDNQPNRHPWVHDIDRIVLMMMMINNIASMMHQLHNIKKLASLPFTCCTPTHYHYFIHSNPPFPLFLPLQSSYQGNKWRFRILSSSCIDCLWY